MSLKPLAVSLGDARAVRDASLSNRFFMSATNKNSIVKRAIFSDGSSEEQRSRLLPSTAVIRELDRRGISEEKRRACSVSLRVPRVSF